MYNYKKLIFYSISIIAAFMLLYYYFASFVAIIGSFVYSILGLLLFSVSDDKILGKVNTYEEIVNNRNLAYAITLLVYAIIISSGIISGSLIFYSLR